MTSNDVLNNEELSFLQSVIATKLPQSNGAHPQFIVDGDSAGVEMLSRLGNASRLQMVANFENHELVFPLELKMDELGRLTMEMHQPRIYETGPVNRQWRLQPNLPLRLLELSGDQKDELTVHDISLSGFSVSFDCAESAPEKLELELELPDEDSKVQLKGMKAREIDNHRVAYQFSDTDEKLEKRLRKFLFQQHQQLYPELEVPSIG